MFKVGFNNLNVRKLLCIYIYIFSLFNLGCEPTIDGSSGIGLDQDLQLKLLDFDSSGLNFNESESPVLVFFLSGKTSQDIHIGWELTPLSTGGLANDFSSLAGQITLPQGQSNLNFHLPMLNDLVYEGLESYTLTISNQSQDVDVSIASTDIIINLIDDDPLPTVSFYNSKSAFHEGDGASNVLVSLDYLSERSLKATYSLNGSASGSGVDFIDNSITSGEVIFSPGDNFANIPFYILNDSGQTGNKTIEVTLQSLSDESLVGTVGAIPQHDLIIIDTEGPLTVIILDKFSGTAFYTSLPVEYDVIFSRIIDSLFHALIPSDFEYIGTAGAISADVINGTGLNLDLKFKLKITSIGNDGTIIPRIKPGLLRAATGDQTLNSATPGSSAVYDVDTPQNPASWSLSSPSAGETSNDVSPVVMGTGILFEEGSVAHIYITANCAASVGSAVISAGAFSVTDINLPSDGSQDGLTSFYGRIKDVAQRTSNCVDLGLSYTLATAAGGVPTVDINAASGQTDPATSLPILFKVVFSEAINPTTFDIGDISTQIGTATVDTWTLSTVDNITWDLTATAISVAGVVEPFMAAGTVQNFSGINNLASVSTNSSANDSTVTYSPPLMPGTPTNFYASSGDAEVLLAWDSCTNCTYDLYWDTSSGVTTASNPVTGLTSPNYTHVGRTNGTLYYYKIRASRVGASSSALTSEVSVMPNSNICNAGTLQSGCTITGVIVIADNTKVSATADIIIASGGDLQSNTGQSISLETSGKFIIETGGMVNANFTSIVVSELDTKTGAVFTGDITNLSVTTMTVSGTMNSNIIDSNIINLVVNVGGILSANGRGFAPDTGTSPGAAASNTGAGGAHAGKGGRSTAGSIGGATTYGVVGNPVTFGSGGGSAGAATGGSGGGVLKLILQGTLTNNGSISANGNIGVKAGGGGGGGSIWIDVGILSSGGAGLITGTGSIAAIGGRGPEYFGWGGGGGGGGRISLHCQDFKSRGVIDVHPGNGGGKNSSAGNRGSYELQVTNVDSLCDTGSITGAADCLLSSALYLGDGYVLTGDSYAIDGLGSIHGNIQINLTNNLTLSSGAEITAQGYGADFDLGGYPASYATGGGGGGHGGVGGKSNSSTLNGGSSYGNSMNPLTLGSPGGGSGGSGYSGVQSWGGGSIKILIGGVLTNDGTITASGYTASGSGAGGSGGSVLIDVGIVITGGAGEINGSGVFTAVGGNGSRYSTDSGGGGGGGRIAILTNKYNFRGGVDYSGGRDSGYDSQAGTAGSYYMQVTDMDSLCDTGTMGGAGDCTLTSTLYLGQGFNLAGENYTIDSGGELLGNFAMTIAKNLTIAAGGKISADGFGDGVGDGYPSDYNVGAGGGGHGGMGGHSNGAANGGPAHGSDSQPITYGSGGGAAGGLFNSGLYTRGGGALKIFVGEILSNNGIISANGNNGSGSAGGGAGGSIWIDVGLAITPSGATEINGMGTILALGGRGSRSSNYSGGGGGGGRIAIHSENFKFRGIVNIKGGISSGYGSRSGSPGVYYQVLTNVDSLCDTGTMSANCVINSSLYLAENYTVVGTELTVSSGGSIYGNSTLDFSGDLTVASGGLISSVGFGDAGGVGFQTGNATTGGGGGHGGNGGRSYDTDNGGISYGDFKNPVTKGTGGGAVGGSGASGNTSNGGGALKILVGGTLTNDGSISSNGEVGSGVSGAGAGGSLWLDVGITNTGGLGILTGTGDIFAKGGNGSNYSFFAGGGGGGGRLAIYSVEYLFRGTLSVSGGTAFGIRAAPGLTGSFYQELQDLDSLCDSATSFSATCLITSSVTIGDGLNISGTALTIDVSGTLSSVVETSDTELSLTGDLNVNSGGLLELNFKNISVNDMNINGTLIGNIFHSQIANLNIVAGGAISANSKGLVGGYNYGNGVGQGAGIYDTRSGGGGGYAGAGGNGNGAAATGGPGYGISTLPIYFGSGGAAGDATNVAGDGGGLLQLIVTNTLTVDGNLSVNGGNGTSGAGGGSGGSLWVEANTITGSGTISADGGDGGVSGTTYYGGGGSGGFIALYRAADTFSGTPTADFGLAGGGTATNGAAGVVSLSAGSPPHIIALTSSLYNGDLGGLLGADKLCNVNMRSLGVGGTWKALLSTSVVNASAHLTLSKPINNLRNDLAGGSQQVAANAAGLWSGVLTNAITYDEWGNISTLNAWTGTEGTPSAGVNSGVNCSDWASSITTGDLGVGGSSTDTWLNSAATSCANNNGLYCVSQ